MPIPRVGTLRFGRPIRRNSRPSPRLNDRAFGEFVLEAPAGGDRERSRLQRGNRHVAKDRILPAEGGGMRGTRAGSRRQGHARAFSQVSGFMAQRGEPIRILARPCSRPDAAVAAVAAHARAQHARLALAPERRAHGYDGGAARGGLIQHVAQRNQTAPLTLWARARSGPVRLEALPPHHLLQQRQDRIRRERLGDMGAMPVGGRRLFSGKARDENKGMRRRTKTSATAKASWPLTGTSSSAASNRSRS